MISPATLEQIRSASDIVDVIGSYVPLKRAGANFVALCPFHKEKTPSFNVNPQTQFFKCFGCHKGGDVFKFVMEFENLPFMDAVRRLAERSKIPLEEDQDPNRQQTRHLKDRLLTIHEQITQRWHHALLNEASGQAAREYLARRGVSEEAVKLFRLGCAPDVWDDTVNWSKSKGYEPGFVEQAGLILKKEGGDHYYDRFRGRLIFPICDEQGRVIGFSGRVLDPEAKTAKYVNSPETPIFTKGRVFFGLDKSKRALLDAQSAIVCEGQLDLIACFLGGVQNVVAPQGTAFTSEHARILKRYVDEVVLCFDSDNAGQNAAVRALDSLLASGLAIRVAVVPAPHDPDSYIKAHGGEAFREIIRRAQGFFDFYLDRLCQTNDTQSDKGRITVLQDMAAAVHKTGNVVIIDTYAQKTALRLGVMPESVRQEFRKASRIKTESATEHENEPEPRAVEPLRAGTQEYWLVRLILESDESLLWARAHLDPAWVEHELAREIVASVMSARGGQDWCGVPAWSNQLANPAAQEAVAMALVSGRTVPNVEQNIAGLVLRLRNQSLDRRLMQLIQSAAAPGVSDEQRIELLQRREELRKLKQTPLVPLAVPEPTMEAQTGQVDEPF